VREITPPVAALLAAMLLPVAALAAWGSARVRRARTAVWIVRFSFAAALRYLGMTSPSWCSFQEVLFLSAKSVSMLNFTSFPVLFSSQIVPLVD
jgi:hypothetical protein